MITSVIAVIEKDNQILLGKKVIKPGHVLSDRWHFPGGKLNQNESLEDGLKREILEETNIKINIEKTITKVHLEEYNMDVIWFLCTPLTEEIIPNDDLVDARYVSKEKLKELLHEEIIMLIPIEVREYVGL